MPSIASDRLRHRAQLLRVFAQQLRRCLALDLLRGAGDDTWIGPSPQRCYDDLRRIHGALVQHADLLDDEARRLERRADELDAMATTPPMVR